MSSFSVYCESIEIQMAAGPDVRDITLELSRAVLASGIETGTLDAMAIGATGSLTTIEYEPGVVADLKQTLNRLVPPGLDYQHEKAWHDGNAHSHVQAALLGASVALPVREGRLRLGTWQQVILINHDSQARMRIIEVTVTGMR